MEIQFRAAEEKDLAEVYTFYKEVCLHQVQEEYSPDWHMDVYPSGKDLEEHIQKQEMYLCRTEGKIAGAFVLSDGEDPIYKGAFWKVPCADDEVMVLHLLAVHPSFRGHGLAMYMLDAMKCIVHKKHRKAVHLDVVQGNLAADRLYLKAGFVFACEHDVYYEDTGEITVRLYEYDL